MSTQTIRALMGVINNALLNYCEGDARNESIEASRQIEALLDAIDHRPPVTGEPMERETESGKAVRILCYDRDTGCTPYARGTIIGLVRDSSCEELIRWESNGENVDGIKGYNLKPFRAATGEGEG